MLFRAMNPLELTCAEVADELSRCHGKGLYHATALYREVFKQGGSSFVGLPEFAKSRPLALKLAREMCWPACRIATQQEEGGVLKFATELDDGCRIESVIIPGRGRSTLCVSSQVGCRMACQFCATGSLGFVRDLHVGEIVWQVHAARFILRRPVDNVVFMGMGEPLDNVDNVMHAVRVMSDQHGLDIACSHMTLSTAGHIDGLRALAAMPAPRPHLALSLHATDDELRSRLMPINRTYPLARIKEALLAFPFGKRGVVFIEYVLLAGVNDSRADARHLARYLQGIPVRVNLMAYNGGGAPSFTAPTAAQVTCFRDWLAGEGLFVRVRSSRGEGVMAACGQLGAATPAAPARLSAASADTETTHRDGAE